MHAKGNSFPSVGEFSDMKAVIGIVLAFVMLLVKLYYPFSRLETKRFEVP